MREIKPEQRKKMADEEIVTILKAERSSALGTNSSSDLSQQRIQALDYYMGDMTSTLPAEEGRSAAVSTDVQDVVEGVLPILLDVFTCGENVVEFRPRGPEDEAAAAQETDVINHVFYQENDGFLTLYTAFKDALLQKNGFVKWWMEEDEERNRESFKGLTEDALGTLAADKRVKIVEGTLEKYEETNETTRQPVTLYDCVVEAVKKVKRPRIMAVPPEEVLVSKNARNMRDTGYLAHVQYKPQTDVIKLYPDKEQVIKDAPGAILSSDNDEAIERQTVQDNQDQMMTAADTNREMRMLEIVEHYVRLAVEADGVVRRYRITTIGTQYHILDFQEVTNWCMASGTAIIMSHRLFGRSLADLAIDIQEIKTSLLRATLDNAYYANNQRIEIAESHAGENTIDDLLNNRVGGIVRTKLPGGLNALPAQPIGSWVMGTIEYMDGVRENRTGVSRYNQGIDADTLNHTATGITKIMDAAQMRVKTMARILAETLIKDMFRGLHQMLQENGEAEFTIKLRSKWVTVDPREWKNRRHMTVELPLGAVGKEQMLQFFGNMLSIQEKIIQSQGGPNGPLCSYENVYNTLEKMVQLGGLKSVHPYFMQPPPPNPNAPPPPNPKMVEAQGKVQAMQAQAQTQAQIDQQQQAHEQQMEQAKIVAQQQREQLEFAHKQALDKMRFEHDTQMEQIKIAAKIRLEAFEAQERLKLERQKAEDEAALNRQQAMLDASTGATV